MACIVFKWIFFFFSSFSPFVFFSFYGASVWKGHSEKNQSCLARKGDFRKRDLWRKDVPIFRENMNHIVPDNVEMVRERATWKTWKRTKSNYPRGSTELVLWLHAEGSNSDLTFREYWIFDLKRHNSLNEYQREREDMPTFLDNLLIRSELCKGM